jgi:GNAT superfamily N-acetyltransferase
MDQMPMTSGKYYPVEVEETAGFGDAEVFFRPVKPSDEDLEREFFYSLSDESVYYRFFNIVKAMPHEKLQPLVNIDYRSEMAIAGFIGEAGEEEMVAIGRYKTDPADNLAEIAFLVRDDWQQRGIGTYLFNKLTDHALKRGLSGFKAEVLSQNKKMMYVFHKSRFPVKTKLDDGSYYLEIRFSGGEKG